MTSDTRCLDPRPENHRVLHLTETGYLDGKLVPRDPLDEDGVTTDALGGAGPQALSRRHRYRTGADRGVRDPMWYFRCRRHR